MEPRPLPAGRHPVHVGHLVMGLALLGLVGIWSLVEGGLVGTDDVRWLLPLPWVLAGIAGLLATTLSGRGRTLPGAEPSDARPDRRADRPFPTYDDPTQEIR